MARRKQGPDGSTLKLLLPTLKLVFVDLTACIAFLEDIDRVAGLANAVAGEHTEDEDGNGDISPQKRIIPKPPHQPWAPPHIMCPKVSLPLLPGSASAGTVLANRALTQVFIDII